MLRRLALYASVPALALALVTALVLDRELLRWLCGKADPFLLALDLLAWACVLVGWAWLRWQLSRRDAPEGFLRPVLDLFALRDLHRAAWLALLVLLVLPGLWWYRGERGFLHLLTAPGLKERLQISSDLADGFDRLSLAYQFALLVGLPLVAVIHLSGRWLVRWPKLAWWLLLLFVPALIVGFILLVSLLHLA